MNNEYNLSDLGSAAYLLAIGQRLLRLDYSNPKRVQFIFEYTPEVEEKVRQYWDGTARVAPLSLQTSQKTLKARIYANQPC